MKTKIVRRKPVARSAAGVTLPEVLIAIFVLGIGIMAVISLVFAAGHFGRQAVRHTEAARISRAVANFFETMDGPWWSAFDPPSSVSTMEILSQQMPAPNPPEKELRPNYTMRNGTSARDGEPLVWRCIIARSAYPQLTKLYELRITVSSDADLDERFDARDFVGDQDADPPVRTFVTQIIRPE